MKAFVTATLLGLPCAFSLPAQLAFDAPDKGVVENVAVGCDAFARTAKQLLIDRGLKPDQDWACGPDYRCVVFRNAPPRTAEGKPLSRSDVVKDYLQDPAKADFRWKSLSHGYWAVPNSNFVMGASLQLKQQAAGCSAKLEMSFGLGGREFLWILPYDPYTWPIPPDNGRLQKDYMAEILKRLAR